jgi:hypothetical protein
MNIVINIIHAGHMAAPGIRSRVGEQDNASAHSKAAPKRRLFFGTSQPPASTIVALDELSELRIGTVSRRSVMFRKLAIALAATTIAFGVASTPTGALARGFGGGAHFGGGGMHFGGGGARFGGGVARFGGLRSYGPVARGYGGYYGGRSYYYGGRRFGYGLGALGLLGAGLAYNYTSCYVWTPYGYINECGYSYSYGWY